MTAILIYGTGGMGREAAQAVRDIARSGASVVELAGFIDDRGGGPVHGLPVVSLADAAARWPDASVVIAVGDPGTRERLHGSAAAAGLRPITIRHPRAEIGDGVSLGEGCYVAPGTILTCDLTLGAQVQVNVGVVVHHDAVIGDFVTLSPRVTVSGNVRVGRGAFLGAGAVVKQGVTIGERAVIGMGAVVLRDVPAGETWVGNPAAPMR